MKTLITLVLFVACTSVFAGEQSVLVQAPAPAPTVAPTLVADCTNGCCGANCRLYNEKVSEEDRCRRTLRGGYVKRQVVRKVYTPVR